MNIFFSKIKFRRKLVIEALNNLDNMFRANYLRI